MSVSFFVCVCVVSLVPPQRKNVATTEGGQQGQRQTTVVIRVKERF